MTTVVFYTEKDFAFKYDYEETSVVMSRKKK